MPHITIQQLIDYWLTRLVRKTAAGDYYEDRFNQNLLTDGVRGQSFDDKQAVIKRGASEYIKLRNGPRLCAFGLEPSTNAG